MRLVFMGSPDFAVPSLDALVAAGHEVIRVYTQPPRPAGRGKGEQKTAVHKRADELGIEVRCPRTLRDHDEQAPVELIGRNSVPPSTTPSRPPSPRFIPISRSWRLTG